jgi:glucose/arabinose dehydrogenase
MRVRLAAVALALAAAGLAGAEGPAVFLPPGFRLEVFAAGLGAPRFMVQDSAGTLLVSVPGRGEILALPDRDGDGRADAVLTVRKGLERPYGLAFGPGGLYVAETGRILRFRYDPTRLTASDPAVVVAHLPGGAHHWTRTLVLGPDGRLYVSVGSSCDVCREADRRRASIVRYNSDGSGERLFATGLRSVVGLAFSPAGALWATVNERDWRSGGAPPDYITAVTDGGAYGWPDCFASEGRFAPDPEFRGDQRCSGLTLPTLEIPSHSAPLGLAFYAGGQFPNPYRGSLFVAYHGSRPGLVPWTGYKIVRITFRDGQPAGVEDFATGWRWGDRVEGRPADLLVGRDGALYIADDHAGSIHRVVSRR